MPKEEEKPYKPKPLAPPRGNLPIYKPINIDPSFGVFNPELIRSHSRRATRRLRRHAVRAERFMQDMFDYPGESGPSYRTSSRPSTATTLEKRVDRVLRKLASKETMRQAAKVAKKIK